MRRGKEERRERDSHHEVAAKISEINPLFPLQGKDKLLPSLISSHAIFLPLPLILSFFFHSSPSCHSHLTCRGGDKRKRERDGGEKSLFFRRGQHSQACTIPLPINRAHTHIKTHAHTQTCMRTHAHSPNPSSSVTIVTVGNTRQSPYLNVIARLDMTQLPHEAPLHMSHTEPQPTISPSPITSINLGLKSVSFPVVFRLFNTFSDSVLTPKCLWLFHAVCHWEDKRLLTVCWVNACHV